MKRNHLLVIAVSMILMLHGCGGNGDESSATNSNSTNTNNTSTNNSTANSSSSNESESDSPTEAQIALAKEVITQQGCSACHTLKAAGLDMAGQLGPDLTHAGSRGRTAEWLRTQMTDPTAIPDSEVVEGFEGKQSLMPSYAQLSDDELDAVIAFLMSLE